MTQNYALIKTYNCVKMWSYTVCFFSAFCIIVVYAQILCTEALITEASGIMRLYNGQTPASKVCWNSKWYNNSAPSATNRSEYEFQPAPILDSICPKGRVIAAQCKDQKGEPFQNFKNDSVNKYIATCTVVTGLICNPYNSSKQSCPDYEIQYGCACSTNTSSEGSGSSASGQQHGPSCNGVQIYETSLFMLIACSVLKIFG